MALLLYSETPGSFSWPFFSLLLGTRDGRPSSPRRRVHPPRADLQAWPFLPTQRIALFKLRNSGSRNWGHLDSGRRSSGEVIWIRVCVDRFRLMHGILSYAWRYRLRYDPQSFFEQKVVWGDLDSFRYARSSIYWVYVCLLCCVSVFSTDMWIMCGIVRFYCMHNYLRRCVHYLFTASALLGICK